MEKAKTALLAAGLIATLLIAVACGTSDAGPSPGGAPTLTPTATPGQDSGGIVSGRDALFESLQRSGLEVDRGEEFSSSFFKPTGEIMRVSGEDVQVFEFPSSAHAEAAAGGVSPSGTTIASANGSVSSVLWVAPPHFYRVDNVIAIYIGNDAEVLNLLEERMGPQFAGRIVSGRDALFESLRRNGLEVNRGEEVSQPFFKPTGEIMRILGEDVQVFEFPSAARAEAAAGGVSPSGSSIASADGSVSSVLWVAPPHFYRVDNVIAIYIGNDAEVLNLLEERMGPQFAGRPGVANESPDREMVREPAPIESVELRSSEAEPTRYVLHVEFGLRNGCIEPVEPGEYEVLTSFPPQVSVNVLAPADKEMACTEQYRTASAEIELGSGFWPCLVYAIPVNSTPYDLQAVAPKVKCAAPANAPDGLTGVGYDSLFLSLQSGGVEVQRGDEVKQEFFDELYEDLYPTGRLMNLNEEAVQVFDFSGAGAARKAADQVEPDGYDIRLPSQLGEAKRTVHIDWISTPHFFQHSTVIVIYVGDDAGVLKQLEERMGAEFAGGSRAADSPPVEDSAPGGDRERVPSVIEGAEIYGVETDSLQKLYVATLLIGLPDSCHEFDGASVTRDGDRVRVKVTNLKNADPDILCAQVYSTVSETVLLGADFEPGKTYTVEINDLTETFVAR